MIDYENATGLREQLYNTKGDQEGHGEAQTCRRHSYKI